jgi:glycyl-tRNA synthetase alpha chain
MNFQDIIIKLQEFWANLGCSILQPYDLEKGAGTFNPATFLRSFDEKPWNVAYVEPSRRPSDGRYNKNNNRLQYYYQFQVIMKPSPKNIQKNYLDSLNVLNIDFTEHDIKFIEDDWESPTLGAYGVGYEVWIDGIEVTQFTYFQQLGCIDLHFIPIEITYGLERIAMCSQKINNIYELKWDNKLTYADICFKREEQWCLYNFEMLNIDMLKNHFVDWENEAKRLIQNGLFFPAYDAIIKCSHLFNLIDASGLISNSERINYISKIRSISKIIAEKYLNNNLLQKNNNINSGRE